jgi:TonB-linked SusC/RagA family outer membrane protein
MKITTAIILVAALHVSASGVAQKITFAGENVPLTKVFNAIEDQLGFGVLMPHKLMESSKLVTVKIEGGTLDDLLKKCFEFQPWKLSYTVTGHTIIITKDASVANRPDSRTSPRNDVKLAGTVLNEVEQPLAGATVMSKASKGAVTTNSKGEFQLSAIPVNSIISISYIGYMSQEIKVGENLNIQIHLKPAKNELDKVVIQAYGLTSQRLTTGNIGVVSEEDIDKQPVMNPLLALQGRVAGLEITQTSGYASAPVQVEIRGRNTINLGFPSDPLYIIDGVPLTILDVNGVFNTGTSSFSHGLDQTGMSPAGGQSPLFSLNPLNIESIEVLKDADATAIYGSRGANGVILITTKKGKVGPTKFDVSLYQGESAVTNQWKMLNTTQYLEMRREAFRNDGELGVQETPGNAPDLLFWDTAQYTNWQKYLWGNIGKTTDIQTSLSGGNIQTTFRIGAGYHRETDITTYRGANQKATVSFNLNHHSLNQRLSVSLTSNYSYSFVNIINIPSAATLPPDAPPVFDKNGNLNYAQWDAENNGNFEAFFPFTSLQQPYAGKTNFLTSNLTLSFQILKGLIAKASFGYNNSVTVQTSFQPIASQDPSTNPTGTSQFGNTRNNNWIVEPQLEYNHFINKGKFNILVGATEQAAFTDGISTVGFGYTNDALLGTISNATGEYSFDNSGQYKYAAVFGRMGYNWESKYVVNLNARRDGSSRFGPNDQFGNFGSVGAAWIMSDENWLMRYVPSFISFIKLRGSYGTTGSDAVGDYQYLTQWSGNYLQTYNGVSPLVPLIQPNPNYHWQLNKKLEGAIDVSFLKDAINLEIANYRNRCNNQLLAFPTPEFTGFNTVTANSPASVQNSGWEALLNAKVIRTKVFTWSLNFNISFNRNKLLSYPNISQSPYANTLHVGLPLDIEYLLHCTGVDPQTGLYTFTDKNHDGMITYGNHSTDDSYPFNLTPKYIGGIANNFTYKNWQLNLFCNFVNQLGNDALFGLYPGTLQNEPLRVLSRWQNPGDITSVSKFTTSNQPNFAVRSDGTVGNASFIRLSNLSVSYTLPEVISKRAGMKTLRFFVQGQNIFVFTRYKGIDPETQNFGGMPPAKILTGGLYCSF